jgi:hypothetical protein
MLNIYSNQISLIFDLPGSWGQTLWFVITGHSENGSHVSAIMYVRAEPPLAQVAPLPRRL